MKHGTKVTVIDDQGSHTWTSPSAGFDSGNLGPNDTYSFTFNNPGTYSFVCSYHSSAGMKGTIHVT